MCLHAPAARLLLCFLIKPDGIVRGMMDSYESDNNSQQMDHKQSSISHQTSVCSSSLMKLDGIVRRRMDAWCLQCVQWDGGGGHLILIGASE